MAYDSNSIVTLGLLKSVTARVKTEYTNAIDEAVKNIEPGTGTGSCDMKIATEDDVTEMLGEIFPEESEE